VEVLTHDGVNGDQSADVRPANFRSTAASMPFPQPSATRERESASVLSDCGRSPCLRRAGQNPQEISAVRTAVPSPGASLRGWLGGRVG
jgi:hypothetical protein